MKLHFIWLFPVCKTTLFGVSVIQRINYPLAVVFNEGIPMGPEVANPVGHIFYIDLYRENIKKILV